MNAPCDPPVLTVRDLSLQFGTGAHRVHALDRVSFDLQRGKMAALVGESGCGKSVTAMAIMGLLPRHGAQVDGSIRLGARELVGASETALRAVRGRRIAMVFQDPMTCLNPVHTVGMQIAEAAVHAGRDRADARTHALQMLDRVKMPDARRRLSAYPHEMSGGMRQRVMIAIALAGEPDILIADEPTTALDVTVQAQILTLIGDLAGELGMSILFITHDLGVVAASADTMMVMYAGRIVEEGPVEAVFSRPSHGYTAGLMRSLPSRRAGHKAPLLEIEGSVPRLDKPIAGCAFAPRCRLAEPVCHAPLPPLKAVGPRHLTRCVREAAVYASIRDSDIVKAWS
ncbi:MAG: ABC transporter ATP-binding protein [Pseudomonadota bacterium]